MPKMLTHVLGKDRTRENFVMSSVYKVGDKELKNGKIIYINGMKNSLKNSKEASEKISLYADGANVTGVHNASHNFVNDTLEWNKNRRGIAARPTQILVEEVRTYCNAHPDNSKVLIICHSQGTAHTNNALYLLPKEMRKRVEVAAVAPGKYICKFLCDFITHFLSNNDKFIPNLDKKGSLPKNKGPYTY